MIPALAITGLSALVVLVFVIAVDRKKRIDTVGVSIWLALTWAVCIFADTYRQPPESLFWGQVMDAALALVLFGSMMFDRPAWKVRVLALIILQGMLHFAYQASYGNTAVTNGYIFALNMAFLAQLASVAEPGVSDAVKAYRERVSARRLLNRGSRPL